MSFVSTKIYFQFKVFQVEAQRLGAQKQNTDLAEKVYFQKMSCFESSSLRLRV